ncbi:hypothetical protein S7711_09658 [Stachybotrys chartarum IBT 7711]|uniref:Uncharacterized protein n=1 Tax=Stachybotrys chartarum (strain CBS 109288 / IBT 7711) TaxID=1280523 RepID=A0A084B7S8_STACB|nr:hypothetical protein S7711_09658 [Stachybotrys chartarum IBT 7711]
MAANMCPYKHPVDPTNNKHFSLLQRCLFDHLYLKTDACTLEGISWVLFGPHQTPRNCREWAATGVGAMPLNEWMMSWDNPDKRSDKVRFPGVNIVPRAYRMVDGWRMLAVACSHTVSGTYIASSLRLGKIHECTAAAAVLALAATSKEHCDRFPELHAHQPRASCGDPRRFGIPCFCQGDRLTSALANLSPSPSLNIAPACIVSQWQTSRREFFGDQIANHGSKTLSSRPLISTIVARQQQLGTQSARFMVIASSTSLPNNAFANMFQSEPLPVATGSRPLVLSGCFLPSAAFVDESTENKGAGASFVKALTAMVSTSIAANPRPIRDFGLDLVCSVLPGAFNLPGDRVEGSCKGGILDGGSAPGMIRDIQCGQLDAVEARRHLLAGCAVARHSMVLAMKPRVAVPTALHRRRVLPCSFVVHAVGAAFRVHALTIHRRPGNNRPRRRDQRCCRKLRLGQPPGAREEQQARGHATRRTVFRS